MVKSGLVLSDRYEIIEKVGSGGMANVYKAKCHRLNRFVAIKLLKPEYSDDKSFVTKFRAEAQSVAGLSHPNIVNVYDVGEDHGLYYIVMELVEGITLKQFIKQKGKLEQKEAIGIAIQIAQGLEAAHANHIIHRDIKPQNIIISREGKVKVTDFGIAKATTSHTITSNTIGSVHYISPEQARGGYSDEKSDIYSLGITLYEMLSGEVPFRGENTVSVALSHVQQEAVPLHQLDANIPMALDHVVQKCMKKKPEERYLTASMLISDLKRALVEPEDNFVMLQNQKEDLSPTIQISKEEVSDIKKQLEDRDLKQDKTKDTEGMDPKLEKIMVVGSIIAAVILCVIILVLVGKVFGLFQGGEKLKNQHTAVTTEQKKVPDVTGNTVQEAKQILEENGITNVSVSYQYSDVFEKDYVMSQSPEAQELIPIDETITLVVSSGAQGFPVPDVAGKEEDEAREILEAANLTVKHTYAYSNTMEKGLVIKTNPAQGTKINQEDTVTIVISKGKEKVMKLVPDLRGMKEKEAIEKLNASGLKAGKISYKNSEEVEKGLVMNQSYSVNQEVQESTAIDFTVSQGPQEKQYVYKGSVTIGSEYNPFTDEAEEGTITLKLTQDGKVKKIFEDTLSYDDFPLIKQNIIGSSENEGTVKMYLDGVECPGKWVVSFTKVEK